MPAATPTIIEVIPFTEDSFTLSFESSIAFAIYTVSLQQINV